MMFGMKGTAPFGTDPDDAMTSLVRTVFERITRSSLSRAGQARLRASSATSQHLGRR